MDLHRLATLGRHDSGVLAANQQFRGGVRPDWRRPLQFQDATSQNDIGWTSTVSQPSVDMIQEFSLQTSNFAAEYGQIGGGLYNFTTRPARMISDGPPPSRNPRST